MGKEILMDLQAIELIHNFYNSAWDKLIYAGALAIGIVGILVPILIQWWQKRTLNLQERLIEQNLKSQLAKSIEEAEAKIKDQVRADLKKEIDSLNKKFLEADGGIFFIQGIGHLKEDRYVDSLQDFCHASTSFIHGENYLNLTRSLKTMNDFILPNISSEDYEKLMIREGDIIKELIHEVSAIDDRGVFRDIVISIQENYRLIKTRTR